MHYTINASIDEKTNIINGHEQLTYWNNSPDTLHYVYFHLFQNAFIKGSHLHDLEQFNKTKATLGKYEEEGLGIVVDSIMVDNEAVQTELDNTIMKVYLPKPLNPGGKIVFSMAFDTYYDHGSTRRRMQMWNSWGFTHYNGTQWFPKISVYDRKLGWDTYQHLNKEFYGDFGFYDVTLDFASNYVVEATGVLQNRDEVLPDSLFKKLDIKNFAGKKWNETPSIITPYQNGERKQWHYKANNVHDFAFTADPSYRIGIAYADGVQCVALVQEPHAAGWQNAADYITKIIKTFSEDIGQYGYPKIVAADAQDGMEYPMLTLDGGSEPGYRGLFVHEIGHNWFYGMVGSNETYRAAMDEGFTQFLTSWGLRRIDGDTMVTGKLKSKYRRHFAEPVNVLDRNVLNAYTSDALNQDEISINTHSDDFNNGLNHGGGYREVYFKTASMLYNLQYTLGDSLFKTAMQHYFQQWSFCHPYFEDFKASVIQFTHVDLNWFFDEWFETTKTIDYSISKIKRLPAFDSFAIRFHRKSEMQMPIDFTVTANDGRKHNFYIPNTWFIKQTDASVLPKWYGWGNLLYPDYTARVYIPSGIKSVQIDTTYRLADKDMVDNYRTKGLFPRINAIHSKLDAGLYPITDRRQYRLYIRPDIWWNSVDGMKIGAHAEGDYLSSIYKFDATVWYNTHLLQGVPYKTVGNEAYYSKYAPLNYSFNYLSPITLRLPKLQLQINSRFLDGLWSHRAGFNWRATDKNTIQLYGLSMWRSNTNDLDYLIYPQEWSSTNNAYNNSVNFAWTHHHVFLGGDGYYTFSFRAPMLSSAFDYSYAQFEEINTYKISKLAIHTRWFGRYGKGNSLPYESLLFAAGANPEQMMDNKFSRSVGFVSNQGAISTYDVNHFQMSGGLNLRGYAGYFMPDNSNGQQLIGYKTRSGASANVEVDVENYIPIHPRLTKNWLHANLYGFFDAGVMELAYTSPFSNYSFIQPTNNWSSLHVDAGVGMAFTIKNFGVFEKAKPLTIRFDIPLFLNRPQYNNPVYSTFRYVVGINRAF